MTDDQRPNAGNGVRGTGYADAQLATANSESRTPNSDVPTAILREAALLRALATALQPPTGDLGGKLRGLVESVASEHSLFLRDAAELVTSDLETEYHHLLGAGGLCPANESAYLSVAVGGSGGMLADIGGFYDAFKFDPKAEIHEAPDHIAVELSFCAWLSMKEAYALDGGRPEDAAVCRDAMTKFRADHLDRWLGLFCDRLDAAAESGFYGQIARLTRASIARVPA